MTIPLEPLRDALTAFDGRATTILGEAEARFAEAPGYLEALIALAGEGDARVSGGATWLIKARLEAGGRLGPGETSALLTKLALITAWDAQLHLCQIARYLTFGAGDAERFSSWLEGLLTHKRPFLRAWSLDALCRVALQHEGYRARALEALEAGAQDPAASVKARVRRLRKETGLHTKAR